MIHARGEQEEGARQCGGWAGCDSKQVVRVASAGVSGSPIPTPVILCLNLSAGIIAYSLYLHIHISIHTHTHTHTHIHTYTHTFYVHWLTRLSASRGGFHSFSASNIYSIKSAQVNKCLMTNLPDRLISTHFFFPVPTEIIMALRTILYTYTTCCLHVRHQVPLGPLGRAFTLMCGERVDLHQWPLESRHE